jgi:thiol-disulfide isomerase/thioredoxin
MGLLGKNSFTMLLVTIGLLVTGIIGFSSASEGKYSVGSGNDDWWVTYPTQSPGSGSEVHHPQWVLDALGSKPVVVYVHKGCGYCKPQTDAMAEVVKEYGNKFTYFDIPADGSDSRSEEALQAYDPNGGVMYVPMTVIVTLASDSEGKVKPVWHSTEDVTGKEWIKNYVDDATSNYNHNRSNWMN